MDKVSENTPREDGEKRTVTDFDFPGERLKSPPPLITKKGSERLPVSTVAFNVPVEIDRFVIVMVWTADWPTATPLKSAGLGLTSMAMIGGTAVPVISTLRGLLSFVALCVRDNAWAKEPAEVGEKLTTTFFDCPTARLNGPPPLMTENGLESVPISPSKVPTEVDRFVIVRVCVGDCPTVTSPKSMGEGFTDRLMAGTPVPIKETDVGLLKFVALWVTDSVPEKGPGNVGVKLTTTFFDWPIPKLNEPAPLTTENGPDKLSTLPSITPVEVDKFVMVMVWVAALFTITSPKSTGVGAIDRLTAATPVPTKDTSLGLVRFVALWVMDNV